MMRRTKPFTSGCTRQKANPNNAKFVVPPALAEHTIGLILRAGTTTLMTTSECVDRVTGNTIRSTPISKER